MSLKTRVVVACASVVALLVPSIAGAQVPEQTNTPTQVDKDPSTAYEAWVEVGAAAQWQMPYFKEDEQKYHSPFTASVTGLDGTYSTQGQSGSLAAGQSYAGEVVTSALPNELTLTVEVNTANVNNVFATDVWGIVKDVASIVFGTSPGTIAPAIPAGGWPLSISDATPNSSWNVTSITSTATPTIGGTWSFVGAGLSGALSTISPSAIMSTAAPSALTTKDSIDQSVSNIMTYSSVLPTGGSAGFLAAMTAAPNVNTSLKNGAAVASMSSGNTFANGALGSGQSNLYGPSKNDNTNPVKSQDPWTISKDGLSVTYTWQ